MGESSTPSKRISPLDIAVESLRGKSFLDNLGRIYTVGERRRHCRTGDYVAIQYTNGSSAQMLTSDLLSSSHTLVPLPVRRAAAIKGKRVDSHEDWGPAGKNPFLHDGGQGPHPFKKY